MKKYVSVELRKTAIVAIILSAAALIGLIVTFTEGFLSEAFILTLFLLLLALLFWVCWLAEKSRYLTVDEEKVSFPRGVGNGIRFFQRTTVYFRDVQTIVSELKKGDGFITGDSLWHTMTMRDGTAISFYLYEYGKEAEREIIETIQNRITSILEKEDTI